MYVLIIILGLTRPAIATHDFFTEDACVAAGKAAVEHSPVTTTYVCKPKGKIYD